LTFAYLLQTPDKLNKETLLGLTMSNPLLVISISIVLGAFLGLWSTQVAAKIEECGMGKK
jgi:hypothetical protein